jgi:hypothetical protein
VIHASLTGEGKYMDAESAKKLTQSNLKGPVIEPYLEIIYKKIEIAAKSGKFSIIRPFSEIRTTWPGHEIQKAVWQELRANGYEVTHHSNPDPGYPCSSDYDEISWS